MVSGRSRASFCSDILILDGDDYTCNLYLGHQGPHHVIGTAIRWDDDDADDSILDIVDEYE